MRNESSRTKKTMVNTAFSIASQLLAVVLSFALRTAFIRILGAQYTGVSSVFATILTMLSLSELGFGTAVATALYKPLRENDQESIRQLMDFYKKAYRLVALFVFSAGMLCIPFLGYLIHDVPDIKENITVIYVLYIIRTAASYLMIYKTTLLRADQKLYVVKKYEMFCETIRYLVEIAVLIICHEYLLYLVIEVVSIIVQNYIVTKKAEKEYPYAFQKPKEKLSKEMVISLLKDVKGLSVFKLSGTIGNSIDTMLISGYINTSTVAVVGNYTLIKSHINKILLQFFSAVIPSIGNLATENNAEKQESVFNRLFYVSFLIVNFCSVSMYVLFKPFITVWIGSEYVLGNEIAFIIAFDFFLYILLQAIASFRTANGLFVKGQYRPLFTAILNVILSILLIRRYGIFGTIAATVVARFLTQWYDPYLLYKHIFNKPFRNFYVKYWFYIGMFVACAFTSDFLYGLLSTGSQIANLIIGALICVIVPNIIVFLFTFNTKEFSYVRKLLLKGIPRKKN